MYYAVYRLVLLQRHYRNNGATMAQEVEHVLGKDEVTGSNPVSSSIKNTLC